MEKVTFEISQENQSEDLFARLCSISNCEVEIKFMSREDEPNSKMQIKIGSLIIVGNQGASFSFNIDDKHKITALSATGSLELHEEITDPFSLFSENYDIDIANHYNDVDNLYHNNYDE
jgi:hypothetical protein